MNLLVVDDEYYAVKGITQGIDWGDLPIEHIYEAMDAKAAKQVLTDRHIDVLISDIEMPGENGLNLLEWTRLHSPDTETIFLTGHAIFDYAQKAVQLGSFDYVLKPIDHEVLKGIVAKALAQILRGKEFQSFHETYKIYSELWHKQLPSLVERFWQDLLSDRFERSPERLEQQFQTIYLPLSPDSRIMLILISIERWELELSTRDEEILEYAIRKAASEIILQERPGIVMEDGRDNNLVLLYDSDSAAVRVEELPDRCREFIVACGQYFHCVISCYISSSEPIMTLERSLQRLLALERNNMDQTGIVLVETGEESARSCGGHCLQFVAAFSDWSILFETGKKEELLYRIDVYFLRMLQNDIQLETLEAFYYGLLHMLYSTCHRKGVSVRNLRGSKTLDDTCALRSLQHLKTWTRRLIESSMELLADQKNVSAVTAKVQAYIAEHLHEEILSRERIAASVYLNPAYLSRLFRKETGISLTDYIVKKRMAKAKDLLMEGTSKISCIAEMTGYSHVSYFDKSFKRIVGMTPQEFRKQYQGN